MKVLRTSTLMLVALLCSVAALAQKQETLYLSENYRPVDKAEAAYKEVTVKPTDTTAIKTRYTMDNLKVAELHYKISQQGSYIHMLRHGLVRFWHDNGQLANQAKYKSGRAEGEKTNWYKNGQVQYKSFFRNGMLQDTTLGYYESGKLRRLEIYEQGKMIKGEVYAENGGALPFMPASEMPEFQGGQRALLQYLGSRVNYPEEASRSGISGKVLVAFNINAQGQVEDAEVIESVHHALDAEALRVVKAMPAWKPGKEEGKPVSVWYNLPIQFTLQ